MKWDWCDHSLLQLKSEGSHRLLCTIASVASVSVLFRSKEGGTRVKDRTKNGAFFDSRSISRSVKAENPFPLSFFAPKPNGNACYAGYVHDKGYRVCSFLYEIRTNESNCELFILLTAILTLLAILTMALYYRSIFYKNIKNWTRNDLTTLNSAIVFPWRQ